MGGETLRRRVDVADEELDFPILHDLKAEGATDYFALPVKSALGTNYTVTYATDRIGEFTAQEISDLTRVSQSLPLLADLHSQRRIASNILNAYLGPKTGPKILAGQIRRGTAEEITAVLWASDARVHRAFRPSRRDPGNRNAQRAVRCASQSDRGSRW